jgi:pyruvate dehydrogenase E1 component beta subunit
MKSVQKTGRCVVVQEAPKSFGVASEIIAKINDKALLSLEAPVKRVTNCDVATAQFRSGIDVPSGCGTNWPRNGRKT